MNLQKFKTLQQIIVNKPSKYQYKEIYRTNIVNDQPVGEDFLGYDKYAKALSKILLSQHIDLPISVGIFSSWGTGKTFLLKRIEHFIKQTIKKDDSKNIIIVRFNAWEYSGADVLWAGLVKTIYDETEKKFTKCQTRFFRQFIYPFREKTKRQIIWMVISWIIRILFMITSIVLVSTIHHFIDELTKSITFISLFAASMVAIIPSIITLIINLVKSVGEETMKSAKNIEDKVGFMADVKSELEILCDFMKYKNNHKFVVFIDDLDRCPNQKIIKILDAVMLLLSNKEFPFLTFLSIDPRIIISSIESSFKKKILNSGITGFEYIDKLIQIPFCIPISSPLTKKNIIEILTRDKVELLNQIIDKTILFIQKYNLYDVIKISQTDTKKINMYQTKVKIINQVFLFFYQYFGNLHKHKHIKKTIYTLQEKCQYVNRNLLFIQNKLNNLEDHKNNCCQTKLHDFKKKIQELEEIINYKKYEKYEKYTLTSPKSSTKSSVKPIKNSSLQKATSLKRSYQSIYNIPHDVFNECNDFNQYALKIEENTISDEEILIWGEYLLENREIISKSLIINCKKYLLSKLLTFFKYSPYKHELNTLLYNIEESLETNQNNIQDKVYKSFSKEEILFLNKNYMFLDGNCRRNKRIINIFSISRYIMGTRIEGWYQKKVVTIKVKQKLIKLIILGEQWPYRLSWIFHKLEDYRQCKEQIIQDTSENKKAQNSKEWISSNGNVELLDIYKTIPNKLLFHRKLEQFITMDYDPDIFLEFMTIKPIITIDDFYLLIPYLFNINLFIKNKISQISDQDRMSVF